MPSDLSKGRVHYKQGADLAISCLGSTSRREGQLKIEDFEISPHVLGVGGPS